MDGRELEGREREENGLTGEGDGGRNGEDASVAAEITELAVGMARDDFAAVTAEEFEGVTTEGGDHGRW